MPGKLNLIQNNIKFRDQIVAFLHTTVKICIQHLQYVSNRVYTIPVPKRNKYDAFLYVVDLVLDSLIPL